MTEHIGLQEALDIINGENENLMGLMDDPRLNQFMTDVEGSATEILKDKGNDYLMGGVSFIKACVIAVMISKCDNPKDLITILGWLDSHTMDIIITIAFKMSVGLAVIEELR